MPIPKHIVLEHSKVTVGATSTLLSAENAGRKYLLIQNISDEAVYIKFESAAVSTEGIVLLPATANSVNVIELTVGNENLTIQAVYGICASGSKSVLVTEG